MKKFILSFCLVLCLSGCQNTPTQYESPDYVKIADQITDRTAKKIERQTGLRLIGTGGGMMNHIRMMAMSFQCMKGITFEEGRELVTYCVNEYLSAINSSVEVRPYLAHFPFVPEDVQIRIFIRQVDNRDVPLGELYVVSEVDGKVIYKIREPDPVIMRRVHEETFEEAMRLVAHSEHVKNVQSVHQKPLYGTIVDGRYHASKNIFSCKAYDFDQKDYIVQDTITNDYAGVSFYNSLLGFKKALLIFLPDRMSDNERSLKRGFESFGLSILKEVDFAEGIKILKEEMVDDKTLFVAVSLEKMSTLADRIKLPAKRGYLMFQDEKTFVVLTNQIVTAQGNKHLPESHIESLKKDILEFKTTFEFEGAVLQSPPHETDA